MSGQMLSLTPVQTTDAQFRAWGSAISAALATQGLVQTADTGQINWATVLTPSAAGQSRGYEIWRFNDALQSTAPVYLKIEYGSSANLATNPQMWVTAGTGSDGAGTITGTNIAGVYGAVTARTTLCPVNAAQTATPGNVYVNGNSGCITLLGWVANNANWAGFFLLVERWRNWDGTNSADGVTLMTATNLASTTGVNAAQSLCFVPNLAVNPGSAGVISSYVASAGIALLSAAIGTTLYPLPVMTGPGPRAGAPSQFVLAVGLGDYPTLGVFTMSHYGTSQTWVCAGIGTTSVSGWGSWANNGNIKSFLFRTS